MLELCRKCRRPAVAVLYRPHEVIDEQATFCEVCVYHALASGWMALGKARSRTEKRWEGKVWLTYLASL